jgi:hypothetical protein
MLILDYKKVTIMDFGITKELATSTLQFIHSLPLGVARDKGVALIQQWENSANISPLTKEVVDGLVASFVPTASVAVSPASTPVAAAVVAPASAS